MSNSINYPLVSICIPTYNGEIFIQEALESAISQTYSNLEIIVSDDASTDKTLDIINTYKNKTEIPIYGFNHQPNGIGANWNHCVKKSNGEFIKFLFQDDVLESNCISKMMGIMLSSARIGLVYCKRKFLYKSLTLKVQHFLNHYGDLTSHWDSIKVKEGVVDGKLYLRDRTLLLSPKNKIGEPTAVLLRKTCFQQVGFFNEVMKQTLDFEYWYRVMTQYHIGFVNEKLVHFRLHEQQASNINKKQKIPDAELLNKLYYKYLFWYLHPINKLKLLKLYHPLFKLLTRLKRKINAN